MEGQRVPINPANSSYNEQPQVSVQQNNGGGQMYTKSLRIANLHTGRPGCCCGSMSWGFLSVMPFELNNVANINSDQFTKDVESINTELANLFKHVRTVCCIAFFMVLVGFGISVYSGFKMVSDLSNSASDDTDDTTADFSTSTSLHIPMGFYVGMGIFVLGGIIMVISACIRASRMKQQIFVLQKKCAEFTNVYNNNGIRVGWKPVKGDSVIMINRVRHAGGGGGISVSKYDYYDIMIEY